MGERMEMVVAAVLAVDFIQTFTIPGSLPTFTILPQSSPAASRAPHPLKLAISVMKESEYWSVTAASPIHSERGPRVGDPQVAANNCEHG